MSSHPLPGTTAPATCPRDDDHKYLTSVICPWCGFDPWGIHTPKQEAEGNG